MSQHLSTKQLVDGIGHRNGAVNKHDIVDIAFDAGGITKCARQLLADVLCALGARDQSVMRGIKALTGLRIMSDRTF